MWISCTDRTYFLYKSLQINYVNSNVVMSNTSLMSKIIHGILTHISNIKNRNSSCLLLAHYMYNRWFRWAFLIIVRCLSISESNRDLIFTRPESDLLSVYVVGCGIVVIVNFSHFDIFSRIIGPISTKLTSGTAENSNEGVDCPFFQREIIAKSRTFIAHFFKVFSRINESNLNQIKHGNSSLYVFFCFIS